MKDTIVITWDRKIFGAQIEHLRAAIKRIADEADVIVVNDANPTSNAGWATCPPGLPSGTQDAIRQEVGRYFSALRRDAAKSAKQQAAKLVGRFSLSSSLSADADTITITVGQPEGPYTGWHDTRETAQRIASKIGGTVQSSDEPLPKASVIIAKL